MSGIAIVGMACRYAGARSVEELWENVLAQRKAFRALPPERLSPADYWSANRGAADKTYCRMAAVIEDFDFDRVHYQISGDTFRSTDVTHWLALEIAARALADAGFTGGNGLPRETTGVFLGNTLTGEFSRAMLMRLRWPYVRRVLGALLEEKGWAENAVHELMGELEPRYKMPFPPLGDESLAGGLSNTIAGRIANYFDLQGGAYVVDGACASSMLALITACSALESGQVDVAVTGGVDLSLDPFELAGFARLGALADEEMRVFDARASGFLPGEGCGIVVLMRQADAARMEKRPYALIRGWGIASDGAGGITRPEAKGQRLALRRAYRKAGINIADIDYFEAHGTGTSVGDATELTSLTAEISATPPKNGGRSRTSLPAVGSVKAIIGHTKAAAAVAGLIKAAMVVNRRILPPTAGCRTPHALFGQDGAALRPVFEGEIVRHPIRAGVSAMGFGGINTHIVVEPPPGPPKVRRELHHELPPQASHEPAQGHRERERLLLRSSQDAELFLIGAADTAAALVAVQRLQRFAESASFAELSDAAAAISHIGQHEAVRCAVVAATPFELAAGLKQLSKVLRSGVPFHLDAEKGVFQGIGVGPMRIGFLFPGQAAPCYHDGGIWSRRFAVVARLYRRARLPVVADAASTGFAQPAICTSELAGLRLLSELGIKGGVAVGHSLGEIVALHWAGGLTESALLGIIRDRAETMERTGPEGAMLSIRASAAALPPARDVVVAGFNSPLQTVVSGSVDAVRAYEAEIRRRGFASIMLPVSRPFHSPLMQSCAERFRQTLAPYPSRRLRRMVYSTVTGGPLPAGTDLHELLFRQVLAPVRFEEAVRAADARVDLWLEVGPGRVLGAQFRHLSNTPVISLDAGGESLGGLLRGAGAAYAAGVALRPDALFAGRFCRPISIDHRPAFLQNPCEIAPQGASAGPPPEVPAGAGSAKAEILPDQPRPTVCARELLVRKVAARTELPAASIQPSFRMLSDLHLSSIVVGEVIVEVCREMDIAAPSLSQYADASMEAIAESLENLRRRTGADPAWDQWPPGIAPWVRAFVPELVELPALGDLPALAEGDWTVFAAAEDPWVRAVVRGLQSTGAAGVAVVLPRDVQFTDIPLLLAATHTACSGARRFALIQAGKGAEAFARSLHAELPELRTCVIHVPASHPDAARWIAAEVTSAPAGYREVHYDSSGVRRQAVLRVLPLDEQDAFRLTASDVIAVTGGGKGITAECALALARDSGASLLLLGRSDPAEQQVSANLKRMRASGIRVHYERVDLIEPESAQEALDRGRLRLGPITAILHGAAVNEPRLVKNLDQAAIEHTIHAKVTTLQNVLATVDTARLRLLVVFGSAIARTGLPGEAHYALANAWLADLVESWGKSNPHCKSMVVEWSIWSGAGMGERLGRVDDLLRQGVSPISIEAGVAMLRKLLVSRLPVTSVLAAGRFGSPQTIALPILDLPFRRFLEDPKVYYPAVELVADCDVSAASDPYLDNHVFQGQRLMPGVMALEALSQAASALLKNGGVFLEQVEFREALRIPDGPCTIRVAALKNEDGLVGLAIRSSETGFQVDHVRAIARAAPEAAPAPRARVQPGKAQVPNLSVDSDLYGDLFFQAGRFQRIAGYRRLHGFECLAELRVDPEARWFGSYLPHEGELGDPGMRDAALHSIQAVIPHRRVLPVGVDCIQFFQRPAVGRAFAHAVERNHEGDLFVFDLDIAAEDGSLIERWKGVRFQAVEHLRTDRQLAEPLIGALLEREFAALGGTPGRISVEMRPESTRSFHPVKGNAATRRPDGKPDPFLGAAAAVAHTDDMRLTVDSVEAACDIETMEHRSGETWESLLQPDGWRLALRIAREAREDIDIAATRVWTAAETLEKLGVTPPHAWRLEQPPEGDGRVIIGSGAAAVLTAIVRVRRHTPVIVAVGTAVQRGPKEMLAHANV
jgi:enediyne polyketide synthase